MPCSTPTVLCFFAFNKQAFEILGLWMVSLEWYLRQNAQYQGPLREESAFRMQKQLFIHNGRRAFPESLWVLSLKVLRAESRIPIAFALF